MTWSRTTGFIIDRMAALGSKFNPDIWEQLKDHTAPRYYTDNNHYGDMVDNIKFGDYAVIPGTRNYNMWIRVGIENTDDVMVQNPMYNGSSFYDMPRERHNLSLPIIIIKANTAVYEAGINVNKLGGKTYNLFILEDKQM